MIGTRSGSGDLLSSSNRPASLTVRFLPLGSTIPGGQNSQSPSFLITPRKSVSNDLDSLAPISGAHWAADEYKRWDRVSLEELKELRKEVEELRKQQKPVSGGGPRPAAVLKLGSPTTAAVLP